MYPNIVTNETITIVIDGVTHTVKKDAPNYPVLKDAIKKKDMSAAKQAVTLEGSIQIWSKGLFTFKDTQAYYQNEPLPEAITKPLLAMKTNGEDPQALINFWIRLQSNPSRRSVEQLYPFLEHRGIAIQPNGKFLAYKGVRQDYTDQHSGTVDNKPGVVNEMPRNKISDDPREPCHYGYHVGALEYAADFAPLVVVCEVDPADVVCIPYDSSHRKMRVCKYRVLGHHNGELLPSTSFEDDFADEERAEIEDDIEYEEVEPKKSKEVKIKGKRVSNPKIKVPKEYKAMHSMGTRELMDQPLSDLRKYASLVLHIVGASKIPGGKTTLIRQIMKTRKRLK